MNEEKEKKVVEDTRRSYSSIISLTNNFLRPNKISNKKNIYEKSKSTKNRFISALISISIIVGSIGILILIFFLINLISK
ncbi:hypothetical protein ACER0A_007245 [Haloimpatiens sp. FM7315]|uniref:hypothetical protein n=1 Tax=Haloimpatiens sp. FM7315 TaxID=3298609 RepID=UPI00370B5D65